MQLLLLLCCAVAISAKCCLPDVFQTSYHYSVAETEGTDKDANVTRHHMDMWYDYKLKKEATKWTQVHVDNPKPYKQIYDYNKGKYYSIEAAGTAEEKCTEYDGSTTMDRACLPDEAELIGTIFYGAGSTKIEADRYRFYNEKDNVVFYFNFMPETCVPIDRVEYQSTNEENSIYYGMAGGTYLDFLPEIADASELEPPEHCTPATSEGKESQSFPEELRVKVIPF